MIWSWLNARYRLWPPNSPKLLKGVLPWLLLVARLIRGAANGMELTQLFLNKVLPIICGWPTARCCRWRPDAQESPQSGVDGLKLA